MQSHTETIHPTRRAVATWLAAGAISPLANASHARRAKPWFVEQATSRIDALHPARGAASNTGKLTERLLHWTHRVLALVVKYQQNPLRAARSLSYLHVAMHDAWTHSVSDGVIDPISAERAMHRAASLVLEQLYPNETAGQFEAQFAALTSHSSDGGAENAEALGQEVASRLIERSLADGSGRVWSPKQRPAEFPGIWQPTYPLFAANPTEGLAPFWRPWVQRPVDRYDPPGAPRPGSARHSAETSEVLQVAKALTPRQKTLAEEWNLAAGSVTPAGVWMKHTMRELHSAHPASAADAIELVVTTTAAVSVAIHDAFIDCWRVKMRDWSERPITAVRRMLDPAFVPAIVTPGFPSYVSGHATISAAAATVLAHLFPARRVILEGAAEEAAASRLWGGIHFRSDNEEGLRLGRSVGRDILRSRAS